MEMPRTGFFALLKGGLKDADLTFFMEVRMNEKKGF